LDAQGVALAQGGNIGGAIERFRAALQLEPAFAQSWYHLALAYDSSGKTDQAIANLEEALRIEPKFVEARYLLAGCCRKRGDFVGELRLLAEVTNSAPGFAEAHENYGLALEREQKFDQAIEHLRTAVRLDTGNARYALALGVALSGRNDDEGVRVMRRAVDLAPVDAETHYNLALALAGAGDSAGAVREFESAISLKPGATAALRGLGVTLMHLDRVQESRDVLRRAVETAPRDDEALNNLGLAQLRLKDINGAIASFERAIQVNPRLIKAHANLAQAYQRAGRHTDARRETQRASELTAEQGSVGRAMILVQTARQRRGAGDSPGALAALREAVVANPAFVDAHLELGREILASGHDSSGAVREFRTVLNLDPERADAHYEIGLALLKEGDKKAAVDELRAASDMAPCRVEIMRALGRVAFDRGDWPIAIAQFRRVLAWDENDRNARAQLDRALAQNGQSTGSQREP
jgi:tetratricopeptide (TPR) repeat protein